MEFLLGRGGETANPQILRVDGKNRGKEGKPPNSNLSQSNYCLSSAESFMELSSMVEFGRNGNHEFSLSNELSTIVVVGHNFRIHIRCHRILPNF